MRQANQTKVEGLGKASSKYNKRWDVDDLWIVRPALSRRLSTRLPWL